jgi:hypothetical protein
LLGGCIPSRPITTMASTSITWTARLVRGP